MDSGREQKTPAEGFHIGSEVLRSSKARKSIILQTCTVSRILNRKLTQGQATRAIRDLNS